MWFWIYSSFLHGKETKFPFCWIHFNKSLLYFQNMHFTSLLFKRSNKSKHFFLCIEVNSNFNLNSNPPCKPNKRTTFKIYIKNILLTIATSCRKNLHTRIYTKKSTRHNICRISTSKIFYFYSWTYTPVFPCPQKSKSLYSHKGSWGVHVSKNHGCCYDCSRLYWFAVFSVVGYQCLRYQIGNGGLLSAVWRGLTWQLELSKAVWQTWNWQDGVFVACVGIVDYLSTKKNVWQAYSKFESGDYNQFSILRVYRLKDLILVFTFWIKTWGTNVQRIHKRGENEIISPIQCLV